MNPDGIKWVEISDHAGGRMDDLDISKGFIIGRLKHQHGFFYEDHEEGGYNFHMPDKDLVAAIDIQFSPRVNGKQAVVETVFRQTNPGARFSQDRFEEWG